MQVKESERTGGQLWHSLREDRRPATTRIVEHLVLGGSPDDVVDVLANAAIDLPSHEAARRARQCWAIMGGVDYEMFTLEDWDLVDTLITKLRSEGNEDADEILRVVKIELRVLGHDV